MTDSSSTSAEIESLFNTVSADGREVELQVILERMHRAGLMDQRDPRLQPIKKTIVEIGGKGKCIYGIKLDFTDAQSDSSLKREAVPADSIILGKYNYTFRHCRQIALGSRKFTLRKAQFGNDATLADNSLGVAQEQIAADNRGEILDMTLEAFSQTHNTKTRDNLMAFTKFIEVEKNLLSRALMDDLVIPNFREFVDKAKYCFEVQQANVGGSIPEDKCPLDKTDPNSWGVAICTVDGQRCFLGSHQVPFSMKGIAKTFVLSYALKKFGIQHIEQFVGHFQTHESCGLLCFDDTKKPINAMVNSGFIALCCLILGMGKKECVAGEMQEYSNFIGDLAANEYNQMNTHKGIKEKQDGQSARAIAHFLKALHVLPDECDIELGLDLFYETNATDVNCESLSVMAATLANSGINPLTRNKILKKKFVKYVLSLMFSSGLVSYSGNAAVTLGQPAKSSITGGVIMVIPGLLGLAAFSPKLDNNHISVRGLGFVEHFVNHMGYHPYQKMSERLQRKFPTRRIFTTQCSPCCSLFSAVASGDVTSVMRLTETPEAAFVKDSYKRNALHVAAAQNQADIVKYLCEKFSQLVIERDAWGRKPSAYAACGHYQLQAKLKEWEHLMGEKPVNGELKKKK